MMSPCLSACSRLEYWAVAHHVCLKSCVNQDTLHGPSPCTRLRKSRKLQSEKETEKERKKERKKDRKKERKKDLWHDSPSLRASYNGIASLHSHKTEKLQSGKTSSSKRTCWHEDWGLMADKIQMSNGSNMWNTLEASTLHLKIFKIMRSVYVPFSRWMRLSLNVCSSVDISRPAFAVSGTSIPFLQWRRIRCVLIVFP